MRLDEFLISHNYSKKESKKLLQQRNLLVDDRVPLSLGANIDPFYQKITVKEEILKGNPHYYFLLNKPKGVVTAHSDEKFKTVMDFLPKEYHQKVSFVGRLDKDTEGLIFLTDNGQLNYRLHQDRFHVQKVYLVETLEALEKEDIQKVAEGIVIDGNVQLEKGKLEIIHPHQARITITQGKYHQVKKMFLSLGKKVVSLKRVQLGPLVLPEDLKEGEFRKLTLEEFKKLKEFFC